MSELSKRIRTQTEKGKLYQLGVLQDKRRNLERQVRSMIEDVQKYLEDDDSVELRASYEKLCQKFEELLSVHGKCQMLVELEDQDSDDRVVDQLDKQVYALKKRVRSWINLEESHFEELGLRSDIRNSSTVRMKPRFKDDEVSSKATSSKATSSKSSRTSLEVKVKEERARLAELQIEASFLEKKQEAELAISRLQVNMDMAKASAKLKVYEEAPRECWQGYEDLRNIKVADKKKRLEEYVELHSLVASHSYEKEIGVEEPIARNVKEVRRSYQTRTEAPKSRRSSHSYEEESDIEESTSKYEEGDTRYHQPRTVAQQSIHSYDETWDEKEGKTTKESKEFNKARKPAQQSDNVGEITNLLRYLQAPEVEVDTFDGNPLDFLFFISSFVQAVETKVDDQRGCLARLMKYLAGEPKELVKSCIYLSRDVCYKEAKALLFKHYGDPHRLLSEYRRQIRNWPKLKPNDTNSYRHFHTFLIKFQATMSYSGNNWFDSPELIQVLHTKLPQFIQDRWKIRVKSKSEARLSDFMQLVEEEINLATDPLYSREANIIDREKEIRTVKRDKTKISSFHTNTMTPKCLVCNLEHDLDECTSYLQKSLEERRRFLFQNRLCFACYQKTNSDHMAKNCKNRRTCKLCKGSHPTGLHGFKRKFRPPDRNDQRETDTKVGSMSASAVVSGCTRLRAEVISLCVVPVRLSHKDSSKVITTHALLDNGSQGTFVTEDLIGQLGIKGIETSISIKTVMGDVKERCRAVDGLCVSNIREADKVLLPRAFSRTMLPVGTNEVPTPSKLQRWDYLRRIHSFIPQDKDDIKIEVLIGGNCPTALEPLEIIASQKKGPYAFRTKLGWCVTGPILSNSNSNSSKCNLIAAQDVGSREISRHFFAAEEEIKDESLRHMMLRMYDLDYNDKCSKGVDSYSIEDKKFLELMDKEVKFTNGHYQLPLPLKDQKLAFPSNKDQVLRRTNWLKKKLGENSKLLHDYKTFMENIVEKGYAREVSAENESSTWYIPHFGVYHPHKPEKIRVVFNCSAQFDGMSINSNLMQGPDLTNHLVGVLTRFRKEKIAVIGDIESMFYQVRTPPEHCKYLRFFWWPEGNVTSDLKEYEMCVHLFGAVSSPSCANYALKKTANDNIHVFGEDAAETLRKNVFVDDLLKSCETSQSAIQLLQKVRLMCAAGGFKLTKFVSNSKEVLNTIEDSDKAKSFKSLNLLKDELPVEKALGVHWCIENDALGFKITLKDSPLTRRGILSTVSSVFDPLGLAAPFLLKIKQLLQELCVENKGWDEEITQEQRTLWQRWSTDLLQLEHITVPRCFKSANFGNIVHASVHHFSDASDQGYGQASYLRLEDDQGSVTCSLVIGKARVAPLKTVSIPRLELTAATLSVRMAHLLKKELHLEKYDEHFWTDSQVVLSYLKNEEKRYKVFVANRVAAILENSKASQWRYIPSKENPADDASRGLSLVKFLKNKRWVEGPKFLLQPENKWPTAVPSKIDDEQLELKKPKKIAVSVVKIADNDLLQRLVDRTTSWTRLKRIVATMLLWRDQAVAIELCHLQHAETRILRLLQHRCFPEEINQLTCNLSLKKSSSLRKLDAYLDNNGILRVGGRISKSIIEDEEIVHPIILPKHHEVTTMIVRSCHAKVQHGGRGLTINEIRRSGYWVINCNSFVRYIISKCVTCRFLRGKTGDQRMADLPVDRLEATPPFTNCGVDMFGPFIIKEGRKQLKKYGALFTCMSSRAVHIESTNSLDTDAFILALRRFTARRGHIRLLRCDNGSNFIGAEAELRKAWNEMSQQQIATHLQSNGGDLIKWRHNPPRASHFGGVWERQIRSARAVLTALMRTHGESLDGESFRTLLTEVECIINSRPLTSDTLSDCGSPLPLSPANLLTMKTKVVLPPPGEFQRSDLYCRRRWRRIQHIANEFWSRWRKEYLQNLQIRAKWTTKKRNFEIGDVVILKDKGALRNDWGLARVITVHPSHDKTVRTVEVLTSSGQKFTRAIHKLVLLLGSEE